MLAGGIGLVRAGGVVAILLGLVLMVVSRGGADSASDPPYEVYRPAGLSRANAVPLVLGVGGPLTKSSSGLNGFAARYGFVAAYPNPGLIDNSDESAQRTARIKYLTDVIDHLKGAENIDPNRIYAMGGSQSAVQSYRLACAVPAKLAAIGSVAGALTVGDAGTCKPPGPVSIVEVHGTADTAIPYGGNRFVLSTPATNSFWRNNDGCPQQPTSSTRGRVKIETWSGCKSGTAVRLITYTGGDHGWPRNADIDATAELWAFFSQHSRAKEALATVLRVTSCGANEAHVAHSNQAHRRCGCPGDAASCSARIRLKAVSRRRGQQVAAPRDHEEGTRGSLRVKANPDGY